MVTVAGRHLAPLGVPLAPVPRNYYRKPPERTPPWRVHAQNLYDCLSITQLESPVLCADWLPWHTPLDSREGFCGRDLLVGTDAGRELVTVDAATPRVAIREDRDYLYVVRVELPDEALASADNDPERSADLVSVEPTARVSRRISHAGPVCAVAHCPANPDVVSTSTILGDLCVFDLQACKSRPERRGLGTPSATLSYHEGPCRSVAWSPHQESILLSAAPDGGLCLWDLYAKRSGSYCSGHLSLPPLCVAEAPHDGKAVRRAVFHPGSKSLLASAGDDGRASIWDTRVAWHAGNGSAGAAAAAVAHRGGCATLAFAPGSPSNPVLATGGDDHLVCLWDLRRFDTALQSLVGHRAPVQKLSWSAAGVTSHGRSDAAYLASVAAGSDRRVLVWDPTHFASPPPKTSPVHTEAERFSQALVFIHDAHADPITDAMWAPTNTEDLDNVAIASSPLMTSVDGAGKLHLWRISQCILQEDASRLLS